MKKFYFLFFSFLTVSFSTFSQCDSIRIGFSYTTGDYGDNQRKEIIHYSPSGSILSRTSFTQQYPTDPWRNESRDFYLYDASDSLIDHIFQAGNDTGWVNIQHEHYSFNGAGSQLSSLHEQLTNNAWQLLSADSSVYDAQNNLTVYTSWTLTSAYRTNHSFNASNWEISTVNQTYDSTGFWLNTNRQDVNYDAGGNKIADYFFSWNTTAWDSTSRIFYLFNNSLLDSVLEQRNDTGWKNFSLTVNEYNIQQLLIQATSFEWVDTIWLNVSRTVNNYNAQNLVSQQTRQDWVDTAWTNGLREQFDYDLLNRVIHTFYMTWTDTAWFYTGEYIYEMDVNGYPTYVEDFYASYDSFGTLTWISMNGPRYTSYDAHGNLVSSYGYHFTFNSVFQNNILMETHSYYSSMGGLQHNVHTYFYYAELLGDSSICVGTSTVLFTDSCAGDAFLWSTGETTASIQTTIAGQYSVVVTHANGFIASSQPVYLHVTTGLPYLPMGPDSSVQVCINSYLPIWVPVQSGVIYQWFRNDSVLVGYSYSTITLAGISLVSGIYELHATNACGSDSSAQTTISVSPIPSVPVITASGPLTFCAGDSVRLTSSPSSHYMWSPGNSTTQSITTGTSGIHYVTISDSTGCSSYAQVTVQANAYSPFQSHLYFQSGTLTSSTGAQYAQWFLNNDTIPGATGNSIIPTLPGYYSYAYAVNLPCARYSDSIYIDPTTLNVYLGPDQFACEQGDLYLNAWNRVIGGTPPYQYHWTPAPNLTDNGNGTAHLHALITDGEYFVTVTDSAGVSVTDSIHVFIDHPVVPIVRLLPNSGLCPGGSYYLQLQGGVFSYTVLYWIINGDTLTTSSNFLPFYDSGIFQVAIRDTNGCPVHSDPDTVILHHANPTPIIHAILDSNACVNGMGALWVNYQPGSLYEWRRIEGNLQLGTDTLIQVNVPFSYFVTVADSNGCTSTSYLGFNLLNENINFSMSAPSNTFCDSDTIPICAPVLQGWNYNWYYNHVQQMVQASSFPATQVGEYQCIATSPSGCTASSIYSFNQGYPPLVTVLAGNGMLQAITTGTNYYQWYLNGSEIPGAINSWIVPTDTGNFSVRIYTGSGCYGYSNTVHVGPCLVNIQNTTPIICGSSCNGQLIANGQGTGVLSYAWSDSRTTVIIDSVCAGAYSVVLTDGFGCTATDSVVVAMDSLQISSTSTNPTCIGCSDGQINISISGGTPAFLYTWQPAVGIISGMTIHNLPAGVYEVCITDNNTCLSCVNDTLFDPGSTIMEIGTNSLSIYPNPVIDEFVLSGSGLTGGGDFQIEIYNSEGKLITSSETRKLCYPIPGLAQGVYMLTIHTHSEVFHVRFVKI